MAERDGRSPSADRPRLASGRRRRVAGTATTDSSRDVRDGASVGTGTAAGAASPRRLRWDVVAPDPALGGPSPTVSGRTVRLARCNRVHRLGRVRAGQPERIPPSPGSATAEIVRDPTRDRTAITFDEFVGSNAFVDDPIGRIHVVGCVREYHTWAWDEGVVVGLFDYVAPN